MPNRTPVEIQPDEDILEVLNREFSPERGLPVFSDGAHQAIHAFFRECGYVQIASTLVNPDEISELDGTLMNDTVARVVSREQKAEAQLAITGSIVGPVFLNGVYFRNGIGIWAPDRQSTESQKGV